MFPTSKSPPPVLTSSRFSTSISPAAPTTLLPSDFSKQTAPHLEKKTQIVTPEGAERFADPTASIPMMKKCKLSNGYFIDYTDHRRRRRQNCVKRVRNTTQKPSEVEEKRL